MGHNNPYLPGDLAPGVWEGRSATGPEPDPAPGAQG